MGYGKRGSPVRSLELYTWVGWPSAKPDGLPPCSGTEGRCEVLERPVWVGRCCDSPAAREGGGRACEPKRRAHQGPRRRRVLEGGVPNDDGRRGLRQCKLVGRRLLREAAARATGLEQDQKAHGSSGCRLKPPTVASFARSITLAKSVCQTGQDDEPKGQR